MKQRSYALLAAATGTVLALTACSSGGTSGSGGGGEPLTDGTFKFALVADPPGALNPLMTAASPAHALARLSYDYLLNPDPDTGVTKRGSPKNGKRQLLPRRSPFATASPVPTDPP